MPYKLAAVCAFAIALCASSEAQVRRTSIPLDDTLTKAIANSSLTHDSAEPFHIKIEVSEPENPQSPYKGTIEEWWSSPQQWRREVTTPTGMHQIIVFASGIESEQDTGDYFPLWLRSFTIAAFNPVPDVTMWDTTAKIEQVMMPNGDKSDACARNTSRVGDGERASMSYSNICFDGQGRVKFIGGPRYSMTFSNFRQFGTTQFPMLFGDSPEPGTNLTGVVVTLEKLSKSHLSSTLFTLLPTNDKRFEVETITSTALQTLTSTNGTIIWPPVHSGVLRGHVAMYISTDSLGQVREAWPLASDNAGLEDPARAQVMQWKIPPQHDRDGHPVQIDGSLSFSFQTTLGDHLPELTDREVRLLASKIVDPVWPDTGLAHGQAVSVTISVNEQGELTGYGFAKVPSAAQSAVMNAIPEWQFKSLQRNGKPQYFHGTIDFIVP